MASTTTSTTTPTSSPFAFRQHRDTCLKYYEPTEGVLKYKVHCHLDESNVKVTGGILRFLEVDCISGGKGRNQEDSMKKIDSFLTLLRIVPACQEITRLRWYFGDHCMELTDPLGFLQHEADVLCTIIPELTHLVDVELCFIRTYPRDSVPILTQILKCMSASGIDFGEVFISMGGGSYAMEAVIDFLKTDPCQLLHFLGYMGDDLVAKHRPAVDAVLAGFDHFKEVIIE